MEFQRERVYTALNADELKPGDKVIVANDLKNLKRKVFERFDYYIMTITSILGEEYLNRICIDNDRFPFAYLVERKENCTNCGNKECAELHWCKDYNPKTEPKAEKDCDNCGQRCDGYGKGEVCSQWIPKAEKLSDYNHCEEARKAYVCAMTNACPNKYYRPFENVEELIKVWNAKIGMPRCLQSNDALTMPYIWVRYKNLPQLKGMLINGFEDNIVYVMYTDRSMQELFDKFEFLDGSPCGVEVE